jgi:hypothetical protein
MKLVEGEAIVESSEVMVLERSEGWGSVAEDGEDDSARPWRRGGDTTRAATRTCLWRLGLRG